MDRIIDYVTNDEQLIANTSVLPTTNIWVAYIGVNDLIMIVEDQLVCDCS